MYIQEYDEAYATHWDSFVPNTVNGTFLHTRRYLSYHQDRFRDRSLVILDKDQHMLAVLPAAEDPNNPNVIVSHPGLTYGGLVHRETLYGQLTIDALTLCLDHYRQLGYRTFRYKVVPSIYHRRPVADDSYALFLVGGKLWRRDLCVVVDHRTPGVFSRNRRQGMARAARHALTISQDLSHLETLWVLLEEQLRTRHRVSPVHTLAEIQVLIERFPDNIRVVTALLEEGVIAGLVLYETPTVTRAQYSVASTIARQISALDFLFNACIVESAQRGKYYFDFGNSNEAEGRILNEGLYRYKFGFGAGSVAHDFWEIAL
jgi:hypothetical protein